MKVADLFEEMSEKQFHFEMMAKHLKANMIQPRFQVAVEKALWVDVRLPREILVRMYWDETSDLWGFTVFDNGNRIGTHMIEFDDVVPKIQKLQSAASARDKYVIKAILDEGIVNENQTSLVFNLVKKLKADKKRVDFSAPYPASPTSIHLHGEITGVTEEKINIYAYRRHYVIKTEDFTDDRFQVNEEGSYYIVTAA